MQENFKSAAIGDENIYSKFKKLSAASDKIIGDLNDAEYGAIGQEILEKRKQLGIIIEINSKVFLSDYDTGKAPYGPVYTSFSMVPKCFGFANSIMQDPHGMKRPLTAARADLHESAHGIALNSAPILHCSPWNALSRIVLCPRDYVKTIELSERDAFTKQVWACSLAVEKFSDMSMLSDFSPVSTSRFSEMRKFGGSLKAGLRLAAIRSLQKCHKIVDDIPNSYEDYYREWALDDYRVALGNRMNNAAHALKPIYVRIETADMLSIGNSYGPNAFLNSDGDFDNAFVKLPAFTDDEKKALSDLNDRLGIKDEGDLPTFREALGLLGITQEHFLERSRRQGLRDITATAQPAFQPLAAI